MNPLKEQTLIDCGLTKNESKVYLAMLKLGASTAIEISRKSKVHRVNVYDSIERLREKGLISSIIQSNKKIFEPGDPNQIKQLLLAKEELLKEIMPQLKADYSSKKEKQEVYHFFGPKGVLQAYYMMLEQNKTIFALGGSGLNREYLKHRYEMWNKTREEKKIEVKALYYEFRRKEKTWPNIRYMPDKFKTLGMVDICGNLIVNLIPVKDNIMAIVIENEILANTYRQFFNFMWEFAKP